MDTQTLRVCISESDAGATGARSGCATHGLCAAQPWHGNNPWHHGRQEHYGRVGGIGGTFGTFSVEYIRIYLSLYIYIYTVYLYIYIYKGYIYTLYLAAIGVKEGVYHHINVKQSDEKMEFIISIDQVLACRIASRRKILSLGAEWFIVGHGPSAHVGS